MQCTPFDLNIAQDRGLKTDQTSSFSIIIFDTMPSEVLVRVVKLHKENSETEISFDTRSANVTDVTRSSSSLGTEEKPSATWKQHGENPRRGHNDKAQISCIDFRVEREPDQLTEEEEQKKSHLFSHC